MVFLSYSAEVLPKITLIGKDTSSLPHKNIRRISDDYIFYLVTLGELFVCEENVKYTLKKGDCFLFEPGKLHFGTKSGEYNLIYIHFRHPAAEIVNISKEAWLKSVHDEDVMRAMGGTVEEGENLITIPKYTNIGEASLFFEFCSIADRAIKSSELLLKNCDTLCALAVDELFIELNRNFIEMNSDNEKSNKIQFISFVLEYLNNNYMNKITGDIISKDLCYSFDYLNQLFKKYLDTSIFKTLESIRIEAAKRLIMASNFSLEKIAESVGFKDVSYFSKTFKKNTGITPSKYRQKLYRKDL